MPDRPEVTLAPSGSGNDLKIAERFGIKVASARDTTAWQLVRSAANMDLCAPAAEGGYKVRIDVADGPMARRLHTARRTDGLPRAFGLHKRRTATIVDATAGLGRDAMVLAHLGCAVTALECVPAFCALLELAANDLGAQIEVQKCDSIEWLRGLTPERAPDAIYLDPMFAEPGKSQVKKEMQACRILAGEAPELQKALEADLLAAARAVAKERVVVKRHPHSSAISDDVSHSVEAGRVRFDVYLCPPATG